MVGYGDYYGVMSLLVNTDLVDNVPTSFADLLKPEYVGMVALAGDPRASNQAILGVMAAGMARGAEPGAAAAQAGLEYFAELNAAQPIFGEDPARSFWAELQADPRVGDFRIVASHQESLHSHDAVSVLTIGDTFAATSLDPKLFTTLFHVG